MKQLFSHIDTEKAIYKLRCLADFRLGVAHHADADGCISAAFTIAAFGSANLKSSPVSTDDFCLSSVSKWVKANELKNLVTLDINVFSKSGAIQDISRAVPGEILVIDDHLGVDKKVPKNVQVLDLLPPEPRTDRSNQIRPTFLFCDTILKEVRDCSVGAQDFLVLAGIFGEGVKHLFDPEIPELTKRTERFSRTFGRGLTAYFLTTPRDSGNSMMVDLLVGEILKSSPQESVNDAAKRIEQSEVTGILKDASGRLEAEVARCANAQNPRNPWVSTSEFNVFFVPVDSHFRIVNLVASQVRTDMNQGITIALQQTENGDAIELRRARHMNSPNLVDYLLAINSDCFISRGGHPMACGATIAPGFTETVLGELKLLFTRNDFMKAKLENT